MQERELRASIAAVGPLLPVLIWRNRVVDGEKRDRICAELGLVPRVQTLHSLGEVCTALWSVHPDRAIAEATAANAASGVQAIAALCSARVGEVAALIAAKGERKKAVTRSPRKTRSQKTVMIQFWAEPQFKHFVKRAGATERLDLSATLRVAAWEYVQRRLPRAPTEGSASAPAVAWVKPAERRRAMHVRGCTCDACLNPRG